MAAGAQLYAFPIDLELPNGTLRFRTREEEAGYMPMNTYSTDSTKVEEEEEGESTPMNNYGTYSSIQSRFRRTIDHQRVTGFTFLQELMDA